MSLVLFADCDITSVTYILEHLLYEPNNARNCPEESVEEVNKPSTLWGRRVSLWEKMLCGSGCGHGRGEDNKQKVPLKKYI